ncbi:hypothetical protein KGQ71_02755 [Patescibacteria group bacterium]|nr:hypothetical protein [Patescibacteria group bacterium]
MNNTLVVGAALIALSASLPNQEATASPSVVSGAPLNPETVVSLADQPLQQPLIVETTIDPSAADPGSGKAYSIRSGDQLTTSVSVTVSATVLPPNPESPFDPGMDDAIPAGRYPFINSP